MHLIFGNPVGWWALLGLPVLVLIHFLQRQTRRVEISTMFLLEKHEVESRAGRRLVFWRNSTLFWLQSLAVLLLAWMLSEPRWVESGTLQRIALVLDSSLAMEAFRSPMENGLAADTATLLRGASRTEWLLLDSDVARPPLYHGEDRAALLQAVANWHANQGPHDPAPALRSARTAVGNEGLVFFVTYHPPATGPLPVEAHPLAYGHTLDNVGVGAATAEMAEGHPVWRVLVRNYAATAQKRAWWYESGGQKSPEQVVDLPPGATVALQGAFPSGSDRIIFALQPDDFTLDDRIPLVLPQPKQLAIAFHGPDDFINFLQPFLQLVSQTAPVAQGATPDLLFQLGGNVAAAPPGATQIYFGVDPAGDAPTNLHAHPAPEKDPLMDGLNWSGLLYHALPPLPPERDDLTLMWDGGQPLITLRAPPGAGRTLIFNFDPRHSNAAHLPAFVLLLTRFAESARRQKPAFVRDNFSAGQALSLVLPPGASGAKMEITPMNARDGAKLPVTDLAAAAAAQAHAPSPPAFFTVKVDGRPWLDGASQFPDPRESDFHDATSLPLESRPQLAREEAHSHTDALTPLWLLALLGVLLACWRETGKAVK